MRSLYGFILVLSLLVPTLGLSQVAVNSSDVFSTGYVPKNYVKNPMALKNAQNVTVSSAAVARDTTTKLDNIASFTCNTSATSGYCEWDSNTIRSPDDVGTCEVSVWYNGDASLMSLQAWDGTAATSLALSSVTTWTQAILTVPCSATLKARTTQTTAGTTPAVNFGRLYAGRTTRVGSTQITTEPVAYTPTFTGLGTPTNVNFVSWRDGPFLMIQGSWTNGTPTAVEAQITLGFNGVSGAVTSSSAYPTLQVVGKGVGSASTTTFFGGFGVAIEPSKTYLTFNAETSTSSGLAKANGNAFTTAGTAQSFFAAVRIQGWTSQSVVMPDAQGWFAAGLISGAAVSLSTSSQASAVEMTNASLVMSLASGSAAAGIPCASGTTNTVGALTCASANESVGFTVSVPTSGAYRVCMSASNTLYDSGGATNVNASQTFQLNRTTAASSTVVTSGVATAFTQLTTNSGGGAEIVGNGYPFTLCPIHQLSAGLNTFRLMYASSISGTLSSNDLTIGGGVGSQGAYFSIAPVNSTANAILANGVRTLDNPGVTTINTTVAKTTTYTATLDDETILLGASGGAWTLSLPAAAASKGKKYNLIVNVSSANAVTVDPNSTETVCGQSTIKLIGSDDSIDIQSDGTNWVGLNGGCRRTIMVGVDANCTATPCTIARQTNNTFSSVSWASAGNMTANFTSGIFSGTPVCTGSTGSNVATFLLMASVSSSSQQVLSYNGAGTITNNNFYLTCNGPR